MLQNEQRKLEIEVQCRFQAYGTTQWLFRFQKVLFVPTSRDVGRPSNCDEVCHSLPLRYLGRVSEEHGILVLREDAQRFATIYCFQIREGVIYDDAVYTYQNFR